MNQPPSPLPDPKASAEASLIRSQEHITDHLEVYTELLYIKRAAGG